MKRPNIVMITCHDLGDFLPCYGTPAPAPHFDRLAAEGVVFQNHFSTGTVCSPHALLLARPAHSGAGAGP